jgi:membrane fusion protein, heavy metal efflux system
MLHLAGPAKGPLAHAMRAVALVCALLLSLGSVSLAGPGHSGDEGHSHDASQAASSQSPRVVATSEAFQLVGILKNDLLTIYLDREQDNSPVLDATVEVSADGKTVVADATSDGTYTLPAVAVAKPGENVLEFSIKDGQTFDLLGGTLLVPGEKSDHAAHDPTSPLGWLDRPVPAGWAAVAGVVVLVTGSLIGGLFSRRAMLAHILVLFASGDIPEMRVMRMAQNPPMARATVRVDCRTGRCSCPSPRNGLSKFGHAMSGQRRSAAPSECQDA